MPLKDGSRMTQRRVAELAGVSQATVSLVLNGKTDSTTRIPEATRRRVLEVIRETTYVADPAARRLAGVGNKILGVFTYEPAFPVEGVDFYAPLLMGIEAAAEERGCDLLMFTSAPVENGRRRIFHENNRLGLADGCLLLGREMSEEDLARLVSEGYPFVAIGRRAATGVPYVGVDYATGTAALVDLALELGHTRFFYVHLDSPAESVLDRRRGIQEALESAAEAEYQTLASNEVDPASDWATIARFKPSALFVETAQHAAELYRLAVRAGLTVPGDLSIVVLGETTRADHRDVDFTRLRPPRSQLGSSAVALLSRILSKTDQPLESELRTLLDCEIIPGSTLTAPNALPN